MAEPDQTEATQSFPPATPRPEAVALPVAHPVRIGRYTIEKILGRGGFGIVYLARDDQLGRQVAVKVAHRERLIRPEDTEAYLLEARTVAKLDHPHIVPVYDVGSTDAFPCYVVSKYVAGDDLAKKIKQGPISYPQAGEIVATIAEALHFAHKRGIVHRDVKPGNILIGNDGHPYVVDFGLALWEENIGKGPHYVGTVAYMSPEQARGEGHRVDGRSDIYSLGVVLYRLLTGRVPFNEGSESELLSQITSQEPKPPRQIEDHIPRELERICLKALSKKSSERYTTALDMAEDVRHFLTHYHGTGEASVTEVADARQAAATSKSHTDSHVVESDSQPVRIVPKGLRTFDEHDADFFLELLPGARDREGLPDSLRFWKTRIEETDADETFSVGLIYGPSGCGKSSLVKAGLLPRLRPEVLPIYVEATPDETEARVLRGLRKKCTAVDGNQGLTETLASLRRGTGLATAKKVLIIIDQFEQWLQSTQQLENAELVQALRQCDGGRVQCIVMVRDDFWMAATRFMRELEVRVVEAQNSAAVDLFPIRHAEKVLTAYGRAFGALPNDRDALNDDQKAFLKQSVAGLAEDGKVISVRLAVFAEMMKDKSWTPATLKDVGGTKGVGVKFLDETLGASTAPPEYRYHQTGARAVLTALMPKSGAQIKGEMKSFDQLLEASGYLNRAQDFHDLIRILDSEIRLITPTDPDSMRAGDVAAQQVESGTKYYQLTHDYLVYPLREWLTSKQRETRRGRAQLQLEDRAATWNAKPENRQLPSLSEYLRIVVLTVHPKWTEPQRRMMVSAGRYYAIRSFVACLVVLIVVAGSIRLRLDYRRAQEEYLANGLVDQLLVANVGELPRIVASVQQESKYAIPRLKKIADNPASPPSDRLRAALVLANGPGEPAKRLIQAARSADIPTLTVIRDHIAPFAASLAGELWSAMRDQSLTSSSKLRLATLLATADPAGNGWREIGTTTVNAILSEDTLDLDQWAELLRPVSARLTPALTDRLTDTSALNPEHTNVARVLARYADADLLSELILGADPRLFSTLFPGISRHHDAVVQKLRKALEVESGTLDRAPESAQRLRNAIISLIRLKEFGAVQKILSATADPNVRTRFMLELRDFGLPAETLLEAHAGFTDPVARQAVLVGLGRYGKREFSQSAEHQLTELLERLLRSESDASERSAAEWLLRQQGSQEKTREINSSIARSRAPSAAELGDRGWWVNSQGYVMSIVRGPVQFTMGSPPSETGREGNEEQVLTTIPHAFAIGTHEVTIEQFQQFQPNAEFATDVVTSPQCPANKVSPVTAMQFCNWLSQREGIADDQLSYPSSGTIKPEDAFLSGEQLRKTGYRLPTEAEWEYTCRAGSQTPWFFGGYEQNLQKFAVFNLNSGNRLQSVGSLLPNPWGLFDASGNIAEWCQPQSMSSQFTLRGGHYQVTASKVRSARRHHLSPTGYSFTGLRLARTISSEPLTTPPN